jgi:hypothetical protein
VTREDAADLARLAYGGHPAAAELIVQATTSTDVERQQRSARALLELDPERALPTTLDGLVLALGWAVLATVYRLDRRDRERVAGLVNALVTEGKRARPTSAA